MRYLVFKGRLTESINRQMLTLASLVPILLMAAAACVFFDTPPTRTVPESIARNVEQAEQTSEVSGTLNGGAQPTGVPSVQDGQPSRNTVPESADQTVADPEEAARPEVESGPFVSVSAGRYHTCALKDDGFVTCWGEGKFGQAASPTGQFASISTELDHTCGVRPDGSAYCWGSNMSRQLRGARGLFATVGAGWSQNCGIRGDGSVSCWGANPVGEATPPQNVFTSVSVGAHHACGIKDDGSVACWGYDSHGQATPPQGMFASVSAGASYTCGLRKTGTVTCWGRDERGGATAPQGLFASIDGGWKHTCGVKPDSSVACWGSDEFGQSSPPSGRFSSVSAGYRHTCGLRDSGSVSCWGQVETGQITFASVDAGYEQVCGVRRGVRICKTWDEIAEPVPRPQVVATGFAECIPQDLYEHLLRIDIIESLEYLETYNSASRRELGTSYVPEVCESVEVVLTAGEYPQIYDDNVFILPIWDDLITARSLNPLDYTKRFYEHFDDEFDFLIVVTSLYQFETQRITRSGSTRMAGRDADPRYFPVSNQVRGIGRSIIPLAERGEGPAGKLQGAVRLSSYRIMAHQSTLLHELIHRWANYIILSPVSHWDFVSVNGSLGGFDIADLEDLSEGRYFVRRPWNGGGSFVNDSSHDYSPIELYLAGFIPAGEVPDLWVGEDVEWVRDAAGEVALAEGRYRIFKPGRVRTYTIEDIIAEHGDRIPDSSQSQKAFRAAVILLIDENHPATRWQLDQLSSYVDEFGFPGESDDDRTNFYEATGGRATISMGGLSEFLKPGSLRPNIREGEQDLGPPGGRPSVFSSLSAGSKHTCGLTGDHSVFCWGGGEDGQVTPQDGEFSSISAGALHTCGIKMDGSVACWGKDEHGQSTPSGGKFTAVSSGSWHTCGIKMDGSVACWGFDRDGQATPPGGGILLHQRRYVSHLRDKGGWLHCLLGRHCDWTGQCAGRGVRLRQRRGNTRLWGEEGRFRDLLGPRYTWTGHATAGRVHFREFGAISHLRGEEGRFRRLLG